VRARGIPSRHADGIQLETCRECTFTLSFNFNSYFTSSIPSAIMAISVACIQCRKQYSVGEQLVGKAVKCNNCGATFVVQAPNALPQADPLFDLSSLPGANAVSPSPFTNNTSMYAAHQLATTASRARPGQRTDPATRRKLIIGLIAASGLLVVGGGIWGVVLLVKREVRRAQVRKMMEDPVWREKILGEKQGWQTFTDSNPQTGFSVLLPGPPKQQSQPFTAVGAQRSVMAHLPQQTFSVETVRPTLAINSEQAEQIVNAPDIVAAGMKAQVTSQRPVTLGQFTGIEFDFKSLAGEKSFSGRVRVFVTAHMIYQVGWMASPQAPIHNDVTRFLDSFSLAATVELPKPPVGVQFEMPKVPSFKSEIPTYDELMKKAAAERAAAEAPSTQP
jgi:hypothetical protein